jgi:two-component system sensor histidine kinase CpxA
MGLRGNLFVKIFIGFWLVTTAILVSWMLSSHYFDSRAGDAGGEVRPQIQRHAGPPHRFVLRTLYNFQHMSDEELGKMIAENRRQHGIDVFLIRRDGSELFGLEVPPDVSRMAASLAGGKRRAAAESRGKHLLAHRVYRENEGLLRAVFVFPRPARGLVRALGEHLWLRIALAVAISGLVCFALSRLMTNRLKELGQASRRLAEGDLDTRLAVRDHGGDETDELARDFNTMAAQRLRVALALAEDDPDNLRSHLQRIERETERLDELIDQLLSTRAGEISLDTHIDLVALLQQLCADAGFEGEAGGVRVLFNTELEQAVIPSSGDLLHKSFENILRNALAHTVPGTEITVELQPEDNEFLVSVEDQGPGVPAEELERIFGEFYRVDTARSRESGGYGLGLAIARRAILRHGGRIGADNTGNGLRVTVSLPIEAPAEDAIP